MYSIILANGTILSDLTRLPNGAFQLEGNVFPANILTDNNLTFATVEKDGELDEVLIDYTLQNLCVQGGYIQFKLAPLEMYEQEEQHRKEKNIRKRRDYYMRLQVEKEMEEKGW